MGLLCCVKLKKTENPRKKTELIPELQLLLARFSSTPPLNGASWRLLAAPICCSPSPLQNFSSLFSRLSSMSPMSAANSALSAGISRGRV